MEFLVKGVASVAGSVVSFVLPTITRHICFPFKYNTNMKGLKVADGDLEAKMTDADRLVTYARTHEFRDAGSVVTRWRGAADTLHTNAQTIITDYNGRSSCLIPWTRYSSSKKAWKLTQKINGNIERAIDFGTAFERQDIGHPYNHADVMEFQSRESFLKGLLKAIKDVSMCSICGIGGVGKTTLARKLIQLVEPLHLFDKIAMITVSQNPNIQSIQSEIIELLGLKISESTMPARAKKLNEWLTNTKTLLILDDVWRMLELESFIAIGIPLNSETCKILLTSRNEDECNKMGSQRNIHVGVLDEGEAWDMFKRFAGERAEYPNLRGTARGIAAQCGGLPLAIVTIAKALKGKPEGTWRDSLQQLKKSNLSSKTSDLEKVYLRMKLSYDLLDDKEAQKCFLLCCLYPEDYNIPIEDLVLYGKSLDFFEGVNSMEGARDKVDTIIHTLKASSLLLDGDRYDSVKMHDILRDFAVSFTSKHEDPYIIECDNNVGRIWPESNKYKNCKAISVMCEQLMQSHPIGDACPKLELLQLAFNHGPEPFSADISKSMKKLKVVSLKAPTLSKIRVVPNKLRALFVTETRTYQWGKRANQGIEALLIGDHMKNLQYFSVSSNRYRDFPVEIGILCNLKFLRLNEVSFQYIPPGVLPKLVKLEELYLRWSFEDWGGLNQNQTAMNASIDEINSLPLTALEISVPDHSVLSEIMVKRLTRFQIQVGYPVCDDFMRRDTNSKAAVYVRGVDITASWISTLLKKSENLSFVQVKGLKNNNGFLQSRKTRIFECDEMEYFVDRSDDQHLLETLELRHLHNLKEICHNFSKMEAPLLFRNLIGISIDYCSKLKSLFPLSVARGLSRLQWINIHGCDEMKKVFYTDQVLDDDIQQQEGEAIATSTILNPTVDTNHSKAHLSCPPLNTIFCGLLGNGKQPESQQMEENNAPQQIEAITITFPQLKFLKLEHMPELRVFYDGHHAINFPSLESFEISNCDKMEAFSCGSFSTPILKQILINRISHPVGEDVNAVLKEMKAEARIRLENENLIPENMATTSDIKEE